jgi:ZIP family zinc transporter
MDAHAGPGPLTQRRALPAWLLGLVPLMLAVGVLGAFAVLGGPGLGDRPGPAIEELSVERTVLAPGSIKLTVRNDGPDRVTLAQAFVNDAFVDFDAAHAAVDRLRATTVHIAYPWIEGEAYEVGLLTSTGATFTHEIAAAVETPSADLGFFGLMALLGLYVGVIPVALGMLWLPLVRRVDATWIRVLLAATVGLLGFLAVDATLEALEIAGQGPQALGGAGLVALGAGLAYLVLAAVSSGVSARAAKAGAAGASPLRMAGLVALGIGLHNLGEGLAIGSAYAVPRSAAWRRSGCSPAAPRCSGRGSAPRRSRRRWPPSCSALVSGRSPRSSSRSPLACATPRAGSSIAPSRAASPAGCS